MVTDVLLRPHVTYRTNNMVLVSDRLFVCRYPPAPNILPTCVGSHYGVYRFFWWDFKESIGIILSGLWHRWFQVKCRDNSPISNVYQKTIE